VPAIPRHLGKFDVRAFMCPDRTCWNSESGEGEKATFYHFSGSLLVGAWDFTGTKGKKQEGEGGEDCWRRFSAAGELSPQKQTQSSLSNQGYFFFQLNVQKEPIIGVGSATQVFLDIELVCLLFSEFPKNEWSGTSFCITPGGNSSQEHPRVSLLTSWKKLGSMASCGQEH
jgi:hypothetical protein